MLNIVLIKNGDTPQTLIGVLSIIVNKTITIEHALRAVIKHDVTEDLRLYVESDHKFLFICKRENGTFYQRKVKRVDFINGTWTPEGMLGVGDWTDVYIN